MEGSVLVSSGRNVRDHLWRWSTYFDLNILTEIRRSIFDKAVHCPTSLHLCRASWKRIKNGKSHSSWLARFDREMSFRFPWVFALVCDRSLWHNGKHPSSPGSSPGRGHTLCCVLGQETDRQPLFKHKTNPSPSRYIGSGGWTQAGEERVSYNFLHGCAQTPKVTANFYLERSEIDN